MDVRLRDLQAEIDAVTIHLAGEDNSAGINSEDIRTVMMMCIAQALVLQTEALQGIQEALEKD